MKKIKCLLFLSIIMICLTALVACADVEYKVSFNTNGGTLIESQMVLEGKKIVKPADPEKNGHRFIGWYEDEEFKVEFDFEKAITKTTTIYAKWILETEVNQVFVNGVSQRNEFIEFDANRQVKENKRTEFMDLTKDYMVGDDNAWCVMPEITFVLIDTVEYEIVADNVEVESWEYDITVFEIVDGEEVKLPENTDLVDAIDNVNCMVNFSEKAIGRHFRVEVCPRKLTEKQLASIEKYITTFECDVLDGYNAYTALDLAYIESRKGEGSYNDGTIKAWADFKAEKGLDKDYHPAAIILQTNISVTADDVPSHFFWQENEVKGASDEARALGSIKDYTNLYHNDLEEGQNFGIYGNYFTLDIMQLKEVVRQNNEITPEGEVISHAAFLRFEGASNAKVTIENVNFVGNAPRVENAIKSGGEIFAKIEGPAFKAYNNISTAWFIAYMPNLTHADFTMEKCRAYDSYNCFVYNWGSEYVNIKDCEMIGAGGPVIIQDHVSPGKDGSSIAKTYISNSKLESFVTGSEGWFKGVHADAIVPAIKGIDLAFNPFGRSFLKQNNDKTLTYLNLICVNKSGDAESLQPAHIEGLVQIDNLPAFDFGKTNPVIAALINATFGTGSAAFQTDANGCAFATQQGLADASNQLIVDPSNPIYQGDYLGIYFNGTLILVGYYDYDVTTGSYEVYTQEK